MPENPLHNTDAQPTAQTVTDRTIRAVFPRSVIGAGAQLHAARHSALSRPSGACRRRFCLV